MSEDFERHQQSLSEARQNIRVKTGFLGKILPSRGPKVITRRYMRYDCCIVGEMQIVDRGYAIDGTVMEVSQGGILFRGASTHVLDRAGQRVRVLFEGLDLAGKVMASRTEGYGIKLEEPLDLTDVASLVQQYGLDELTAA